MRAKDACFSLVVVVNLLRASAAPAAVITYDPKLGTLPQNQGFSLEDTAPASPPPTVSGGLLEQGPTSQTGQQYWQRSDALIDFSNAFVMNASLRVISSSYDPNEFNAGLQRAGYYLQANDDAGRIFNIGISSTGVYMNTDGNGAATNGVPFTPFTTTDGFHTYTLTVASGVGTLSIDDEPIGSTPVGAAIFANGDNLVYFGDGTVDGSSQTELANFSYNTVPEPGFLTLAALSGLVACSRRWRACERGPTLLLTSADPSP